MFRTEKILELFKNRSLIATIRKKMREKVAKRLGFEEKQRDQEQFSFLEGVMEGLLLAKGEVKFVQIGANDGKINDPIYEFLMSNKNSTQALLVEPQDEIIPFLEMNYQNHPKTKIFNGAVGSGDELVLFRIKPSLWESFNPPYLKEAPRYRVASGITSSNKDKVLSAAKASLKGDILPEDAIEEVKVPCKQLKQLLQEYSFGKDVHVIQIDAEGADDEVIYSCNVEIIKPLIINYEYVHLSVKRNLDLEKYLVRNGYKIFKSSKMDKMAILYKDKDKKQ